MVNLSRCIARINLVETFSCAGRAEEAKSPMQQVKENKALCVTILEPKAILRLSRMRSISLKPRAFMLTAHKMC
jgi:hypothetical protein